MCLLVEWIASNLLKISLHNRGWIRKCVPLRSLWKNLQVLNLSWMKRILLSIIECPPIQLYKATMPSTPVSKYPVHRLCMNEHTFTATHTMVSLCPHTFTWGPWKDTTPVRSFTRYTNLHRDEWASICYVILCNANFPKQWRCPLKNKLKGALSIVIDKVITLEYEGLYAHMVANTFMMWSIWVA